MASISIVLHDLRGGGAEKMMVRLANQLAINGDDVELVLLTKGGVNTKYVTSAVTLSELNATRTLAALAPLRRHLKQRQPDAILAVLTHVNVLTALACLSLGWLNRLTVSERNTFSLDKQLNPSRFIRLAYALAPVIYRLLPNPVIAVSQGVGQDLIDCSVLRDEDVVTAPNPVITAETENAARQPASHPWLVDKTARVVVSVGRLAYQKGFDMLLDAFAKVTTTVDARLIIFGEGELRDELQQQISQLGISDIVDLAGYTDNPIAEVRQADLFVLSSRFEGSPNGLVEAMSVGTPVVAFDCPHGPFEILKGGELAPLIEYKNVAALTSAMKTELAESADQAKRERIKQGVAGFSSANSAMHYRSLIMRGVRDDD